MHESVVADAGGVLVLAGLVQGIEHDVGEILALDTTALLIAQYLALRHEGIPERARAEYAFVQRIVHEWFPERAVAMDAALASSSPEDIDGRAALALAESLNTPIVTKYPDLQSSSVQVLRC